MTFAVTWMDLEIIILSEVRERQIYDITYMWNLKYDTNEFICKMEINSQTQRTYSWWSRGRGCRGEMNWESAISRYKDWYTENG